MSVSTVTCPNPGSPVRKVTNTWASNRDVLTVKQNQRSVSGTLVTASQYTYTVDNLPRRTDVSFSGDAFSASGSVAWAYNTSGEVQSANHSVNTSDRYFLYDTLGNRIRARDGVTTDSGGTLTSYTTNTLNQYSALSGAVSVSPTYDLDGNQLTGVLPVNPGTASGYTWNANNELSVVKSGNPLTTLATYQYDPFGRRIMRDTEGSKTWFFYDGWNLIAEYNNVLSLTRAHTWGLDLSGSTQGAGGVGGLLCSRILGTGFYPLHDGNGNITQYVNASGAISAHYEYDPFGRITYSTASTTFNFRFSSKYYDTQTGLSYYGFRYYDPLLGRWLSRDPIGEAGNVNLGNFVGNDATNYWDALGLLPQTNTTPGDPGPGGGIEPPQQEINSAWDALQHYKSKVGGRVPAGRGLLDAIHTSDGMLEAIDTLRREVERSIRNLGKGTLCPEGANGFLNRPGGPLGVNTNNFMVGHVTFTVDPYIVTWKNNGCFLGFCDISFSLKRKLSFEDDYIFDDVTRLSQVFTDFLPHLVAGNGTPYIIYGSFEQSVSGGFNLCCWWH